MTRKEMLERISELEEERITLLGEVDAEKKQCKWHFKKEMEYLDAIVLLRRVLPHQGNHLYWAKKAAEEIKELHMDAKIRDKQIAHMKAGTKPPEPVVKLGPGGDFTTEWKEGDLVKELRKGNDVVLDEVTPGCLPKDYTAKDWFRDFGDTLEHMDALEQRIKDLEDDSEETDDHEERITDLERWQERVTSG